MNTPTLVCSSQEKHSPTHHSALIGIDCKLCHEFMGLPFYYLHVLLKCAHMYLTFLHHKQVGDVDHCEALCIDSLYHCNFDRRCMTLVDYKEISGNQLVINAICILSVLNW